MTDSEKELWKEWLVTLPPRLQQMIAMQGFPKEPSKLGAEKKAQWDAFCKNNPPKINEIINRWIENRPRDLTPQELAAKEKRDRAQMLAEARKHAGDLAEFLKRHKVSLQIQDMTPIAITPEMLLTVEGVSFIDGKLLLDRGLVGKDFVYDAEKMGLAEYNGGPTFYQYQFNLGLERDASGKATLVFRTRVSQKLVGLDEESTQEESITARRTNIALKEHHLTASPDELPLQARTFEHSYKNVLFQLHIENNGKKGAPVAVALPFLDAVANEAKSLLR